MSRPAPPVPHSREGSGKGTAKFRRRISDEQKERLSEVAKERHQKSDGHGFGRGEQKPGTPKRGKKASASRVAALVAEAAREKANADKIIDVFKDGVANSQPMHIRLKAAQAWIDVEGKETVLQLKEGDADSLQRGREELLSLLAGKFTGANPAASLLRRQLSEGQTAEPEDFIEGHLAED